MMNQFDVLRPEGNFRGLSYGEWAALWSKWLYSDDPDRTEIFDKHMIFLRGNLDYYRFAAEGDIATLSDAKTFYNRTGDKAVVICKDTAIFLPILTAMYFIGREYEGSALSNEIQLRLAARKDNDMSRAIWATIESSTEAARPIVEDLTQFRFETPVFNLNISHVNPYLKYILDGYSVGDEESEVSAVCDGYFLILKSLPSECCRIQFGGKGRGNYNTDSLYDIYAANCGSPIGVTDISNQDNTNPTLIFRNGSAGIPRHERLPSLFGDAYLSKKTKTSSNKQQP